MRGCPVDSKNRRVVLSLISLSFKPYCLAFRGRTPAFPAGKVFCATLARIARLGLVLCASMRVARRAADRTLPSPRSVENSSKGRSVDYTWVLRGKAFRVVTVLRATG